MEIKEQQPQIIINPSPPDLPERHGAGPVAVGLLDAPGGGGGLPGGLGGQLLPGDGQVMGEESQGHALPGSLATGGLASGLFSASHGGVEVL